MKSKIFSIALFILSQVLCLSCAKDVIEPGTEPVQDGEYIIASLSGTAKTSLASDGKTPLWAAGDKIALYSYASLSDAEPVKLEITLVSSGTPSATQGVISDGGASFTFCRPSSMPGDIYALYPASAATGLTRRSAHEVEDTLEFAIPQSQSGTFAAANICGGKVISKKLSFSNLTAILEFTLASEVTKVVVSPDESSVSYTLVPDRTGSSGPFYLAVPGIKISNGFANYYNGDLVVGGKELSATKTLAINKIYRIKQTPALKFSGLFSVSDASKVKFTLGNMYYDGTHFEIESHQYEYRTWASKNSCIGGTISETGTPSGHCGLFYWSQREAVSYKLDYDDYDEDFEYLFTNESASTPKASFVAYGARGALRTLTNSEWDYLLNERTGADQKRATGTVAGVHGLIILPDTFTDPKPDGKTFAAGYVSGWSGNNYTAQQWDDSMEPAGAVFLPAANSRDKDAIYDPDKGVYWSSESVPFSIKKSLNLAASAYLTYFTSSLVQAGTYARTRDNGCSIRLVQNSW